MAPIYCKVCKLVFHQKRIEHNASEMHRLINDFLNPRCSVCDTDYFSPMAYERHIATLQHIRVWYRVTRMVAKKLKLTSN